MTNGPTDFRFGTLLDEDGNPPCPAPDACAVCRLFVPQAPGEGRAEWLARITEPEPASAPPVPTPGRGADGRYLPGSKTA